jgi:iron(III) transport system permease protein
MTSLVRIYRIANGRSSNNIPPVGLVASGILVGVLVMLPIAYLLLRTVGAGEETLSLVFRWRVLAVLLKTLALMAIVASACVALAVPIAFLTLRTDMPFRRVMAVATVLPLVVPSYVAAYVAVAALGPRGMLQQALEGFGVDRLPEIYGLGGASFVLTAISYPYVLLTVRAALMRLDPAVEEAARALGRGTWQTLASVTFPLLRPAIAAGALLVALYTLSEFGAVAILRFETFSWAIYLQYEAAFNLGAASSLAMVLGVLALAIVWMESATRSKGRYHRSSVGSVRSPVVLSLGRWRWPAFIFTLLPVVTGLLAPVGVLLYWLVRGLSRAEQLDAVLGPAGNSLAMAATAAVITVAVAAPVAVLSVRFAGRLSTLLEGVSYLGFALPGIIVALALVFVGVNVLQPLYQTRVLLLAGYLTLFLSVAVGALRASLLQVNPHVEEAAQSLGHSAWRTALRVTLPLVLPGILAGGALVFLLTLKELPATLLLSPTGFETLSTSIWNSVSEAFYARAAAPALMLIVVTGPPIAYLTLRDLRRSHLDVVVQEDET